VHRGDALPYVFGYTVLNDISARDLQYGFGGQFFYGKSVDGSCPIGPCIVSADEIPDPQDLAISLRVNGATKQEARTSSMIVDVVGIIERLSAAMTLLPGQIIATGTPPGVGYAREPKEFLRPGDVMESEIEGIGVLRNTVGPDYALEPG
jgi:2-keto-4-pentenoate hydratase/2-oxohepta-3-ene-1,7-dioic acid hydratase in catechol pathway